MSVLRNAVSAITCFTQGLICWILALAVWAGTVISITALVVALVVWSDILYIGIDTSAPIFIFAVSGAAAIACALIKDSLQKRWWYIGV